MEGLGIPERERDRNRSVSGTAGINNVCIKAGVPGPERTRESPGGTYLCSPDVPTDYSSSLVMQLTLRWFNVSIELVQTAEQ